MKKLTKKLSILNAYIDFSISKVSNFRELEKLVKEELIEIDGDIIRLTDKGLDLANFVWEEFV